MGKAPGLAATRPGFFVAFCTGILYQADLRQDRLVIRSCRLSEGDGTRTRNHRIDSPVL